MADIKKQLSWDELVSKVERPDDNPKGWNFPYRGDDWPTVEDWYWVFAPKEGRGRSTPADIYKLWWSKKEDRFLAMDESRVFAWRKFF